MELYPVNLKLAGRRCAVIGGGVVAERKIRTLVAAGAQVTVFSPELTPKLSQLAEAGGIIWTRRVYQDKDLLNYFVVICATDQEVVNRLAAEEARAAGALVNIVDSPDLSDFHVPAKVAQGNLLITISTGGDSPALAKRLREELAAKYGPEYGQYLELIAKMRTDMKDRLVTAKDRESFWRETIDHETLNLLRAGKFGEAEERIRHAACCTWSQS